MEIPAKLASDSRFKCLVGVIKRNEINDKNPHRTLSNDTL